MVHRCGIAHIYIIVHNIYIGNNKIFGCWLVISEASIFCLSHTLKAAVVSYPVTAHPFQSDREKYELLGVRPITSLPCIPAPLPYWPTYWLAACHLSCGQQRHLLVERYHFAGDISKRMCFKICVKKKKWVKDKQWICVALVWDYWGSFPFFSSSV